MKRTAIQALATLILAVTSINAWSEGVIYKCKNQQGILIYQNAVCKDSAETLNSWVAKEKAAVPVSESDAEQDKDNKQNPILKLKQNPGGHYTADGNVDGKALNFVVDTGASFVSLPEALAHDAQIYCDAKIGMTTANGNTDACTAKIKKLQFGPFQIQDVLAVIVPNLSQPLLGMNVLQLFKVGQEQGEMQISIQEKPEPQTSQGNTN